MSDPTPTTPYRELPESDGIRFCWGAWGAEDVLGSLNRLDAAAVLRGRETVSRGLSFSLNWDMALPEPPMFRRPRMRHDIVVSANGTSLNDVISDWNTQSSSQWDGFLHVTWGGHGRYGGHDLNGMQHWATRGIVGRCVLADVGRWRAAQGRPIDFTRPDGVSLEDLKATLAAQNSPIGQGDILLVRFGWTDYYESAGMDVRGRMITHEEIVTPGLSAREEVVEFLWDSQIAAIGADNPAIETWPQRAEVGPGDEPNPDGAWPQHLEKTLHWRLLPALGIPMGEMLDLKALAEDSAASGEYYGLLTAAPINLTGAAATPANALVLR